MSDRIFGSIVTLLALAYIASATQIQTSFLADPVGPKTFPILIGAVAALSGLIVVFRPEENPEWPSLSTIGGLGVAVVILVGYAYSLKPFGFLVPTAITAAVLSYQIRPRIGPSAITGSCLSVGLFLLFKFALGLSLVALPTFMTG